MTAPLWRPSAAAIAATNLTAFTRFVNERHDTCLVDYDDLHRFSVTRMADFWSAVWDFCGVTGTKGAQPWLTDGDKMPGARFFPQASLSFAENLLRRRDDGDALVFRGEDRRTTRLGHGELYDQVSRFRQALEQMGVSPGDRVAAIMPNIPETIIAMLAANSLGAVWSSCSPDFGVTGVLDRFGQIEPKILLACDGYRYNGKVISLHDKLVRITEQLPSVEQLVIVSFTGTAAECARDIERAMDWETALSPHEAREIAFTRLPFDHPLYILFSSGTTGVPKCIVHGAGGTLLQHLKEHRFHIDLKRDDRLFYFTTCGWMMWNWLVSGLASGATLLLYDGSPFYPDGTVLFDYAEDEGMTIFGTSAKFIDAVRKSGLKPGETHDLSALRLMTSTGSPLSAEGFDFVTAHIKADMPLASISGGTDIVACFVGGIPVKPIWRGEIQGAALGMAVDVFDEHGQPLKTGKGELVCTGPFTSMPVGFWNDPDGRKYHAAYFERFDNVWCHGDFAEWTVHGGMIIHGRSDATLNPGGVRIGTAEIYAVVEQMPEIMESIAIGQDWDNDVRIVLFVVLAAGVTLDEKLVRAIRQRIRAGASPRHMPAKVLAVTDIPRTKSGKITELAVRDIVHGRPVNNVEALANPEALEQFRNRPELQHA